MKKLIQDFFGNFIKYLLYTAVTMQILCAVVYLAGNWNVYVPYPETKEMIQAARTLIVDEYTGFLYPLFLKVPLFLKNCDMQKWYLFVYAVQFVCMAGSLYYFIGAFMHGKKAWIGTAFAISIPMCIQTVLMISPFAFKAVYSFVILGSMVRILQNKTSIKYPIVLLFSVVCAVFNVPDDLYVWAVPVFLLGCYVCIKKKYGFGIRRKICILLSIVLVFTGAGFTLKQVSEPGSMGRMTRSVSSVLFQRVVWPDMGIKYGFLPEEVQNSISREMAWNTDGAAERIATIIGPRLENDYGVKKAEKLYLATVKNQLSYNKRALCKAVLSDFAGYLMTPYSLLWYMGGQDGSAAGSLYSIMSGNSPKITAIYFSVFYVSLLILTMAAMMKFLKEKFGRENGSIQKGIGILLLLSYQAMWYAIVNMQGVDYRYTISNAVLFALVPLYGLYGKKDRKENAEKNDLI